MIGKTFAHYRISEKLGAGGMGEVWRAQDSKLGREVALKLLPADVARDPERMARFQREAQVLASLNHPGIAHIYGVEELEGSRILVLELVEGPTLHGRLVRGPVPLDEALEIARHLAEAVEYAHEKGVVHRDLKPANVKVGDDGRVKVLDFGLAKALEDPVAAGGSGAAAGSSVGGAGDPTLRSPITGALTGANVILGTAAYMSPEQARGKTVDRRADIWAFGVILWEMLTGRPLYQRETVPETLAAVLRDAPDLTRLPAGTPARVRELIARCLERDPRQRLRDIGEARVVLSAPGDADAAGGAGAGAAEPAARGRRAMGIPLVLGAAATAAVLTALAMQALTPPPPEAPLRRLDLVAENLDLDWYIAPKLSPDGSRIAYSANGQIWARDLQETDARPIAQITDWTAVFWSPDGESIAYASGNTLWKVPFRGGAPVAITRLPESGSIVGADWGKDGTIIFAAWRGGLYRVSDVSGTPELLIPVDPDTQVDFHFPTFLPDGSILRAIHWKSGVDSTGNELPFLSVFDGEQDRPVELAGTDDELWPVYRWGHLFYIRSAVNHVRSAVNAGIWAAPFDPKSARVTGEPFPVVQGASSISLSDDGSLLYVEGGQVHRTFELGWTDSSGKWLGAITEPRPFLESPALSPDGKRVAYVAGEGEEREIHVHDLARKTDMRLTFEDGQHDVPRWLGNDRILYTSKIGINSLVRVRRADGAGAPRDIFREGGVGLGTPLVETTPDGREFLEVMDAVSRGELRRFAVPEEGLAQDGLRVLQGEPEPNVLEMRLSPDGRLLAYVSPIGTSPFEVLVTRYPSGDGTWQVSNGGGRLPRWDPGTGNLHYVSSAGLGRRSLVRVDIDADEDVPVGGQRTMFDLEQQGVALYGFGEYYEVAAGGDRFLVVRRSAEESERVRRMILVQGWRGEFEGVVRRLQ